MATRDKRIAAIRRNSRAVRFEDLRSALLGLGFAAVPGKGDHWKFSHPLLPWVVTVDPRRPFVLRVYVEATLQAIDYVVAATSEVPERTKAEADTQTEGSME